MSGGIGIDLGSQQCVASAVSKAEVKVLVSELGKAGTPAVVGFTDKQKAMGEAGLTQLVTDPSNTVSFSVRFLIKALQFCLIKKKNIKKFL